MAKIVFCEDELLLQKLVRLFLRSMKHDIFLASDGLEGFAIIEREHPDLILTDISMPRCDGFQLAKAVKARPNLATIPIVFVTAFAQRADVEEGAHYGAAGYLFKPFTIADLRATIEEMLLLNGRNNRGEGNDVTQLTETH